jgi:hypothetical protein
MKKIIIVGGILALLLSGCAGSKTVKVNDNPKLEGDLANLPRWVIEPDINGGLAAVGMAQPSKGGLQFQIPKAEMDARANIATKINTKISRITKQALREANVSGVNDVEEVFSQATKEVIKDIPLSGVKRINMYKAKDGVLYVRMQITEEDYSKYLENSHKIYEKMLRGSNLSKSRLTRAQEAANELFEELDRERNIN